MQLQRKLFSITTTAILLQLALPDTILSMWDRPVLPCTSSKNYAPPPRLPYGTSRETNIKNIDGANIWTQSIGEGKPVIVIHGGPGLSHDYLMPHMELLAAKNKVIFYDQRGCGQSEGCGEPEKITVDQYVKDIEEIRKAYGYPRVAILGHSWGGYLAMNYAIAHPENVDKLVLVNSLPSNSIGLNQFSDEYNRRTAPIQYRLDYLCSTPEFFNGDPATTEDYYRTIFKTYTFNGEKAEELNLRMTPEAAVNGRAVAQAFSEDFMSEPYDLRPNLRRLNIPTLVIHGDVDPIPSPTAEETYKSIPGAKFVVFQDSGHFPFVESPGVFFDTVTTFLQ